MLHKTLCSLCLTGKELHLKSLLSFPFTGISQDIPSLYTKFSIRIKTSMADSNYRGSLQSPSFHVSEGWGSGRAREFTLSHPLRDGQRKRLLSGLSQFCMYWSAATSVPLEVFWRELSFSLLLCKNCIFLEEWCCGWVTCRLYRALGVFCWMFRDK